LAELPSQAAAVGVPGPGGGPERLVVFLVPQQSLTHRAPQQEEGAATPAALRSLLASCQATVKQRLNPLFKVDQVRAPIDVHVRCADGDGRGVPIGELCRAISGVSSQHCVKRQVQHTDDYPFIV
jgi:hypothetical protein